MQIILKHLKRCSVLLLIIKIHIKTSLSSDTIVFQASWVTLNAARVEKQLLVSTPLTPWLTEGKRACLRIPSELVASPEGKPRSPGSQPSACPLYHTDTPPKCVTSPKCESRVPALLSCTHFTSLFCKIEARKELQLTFEQPGFGLPRVWLYVDF